MYICGGCGKGLENIDMNAPIRCPYCGYRVVYKQRPLIAKKVEAR